MVNLNSFFALQKNFTNAKSQQNNQRKLIRREAVIGGQLFGELPKNRRREFFCLDERTWVWHEEWVDQYNHLQSKTTRYEVQNNRILKFQDGQYFKLDDDELRNFYKAVRIYSRKVRNELYASVA